MNRLKKHIASQSIFPDSSSPFHAVSLHSFSYLTNVMCESNSNKFWSYRYRGKIQFLPSRSSQSADQSGVSMCIIGGVQGSPGSGLSMCIGPEAWQSLGFERKGVSFSMAARQSAGENTACMAGKVHPTASYFFPFWPLSLFHVSFSLPPRTLPPVKSQVPSPHAFLRTAIFVAPSLTPCGSQGPFW